MSCTFDQEQVALFASGDLSPEERQAVELHIGKCEECRSAADLYRQDAEVLAALGAAPVEPLRRRRSSSGRLKWVSAAAAVLLLLALTPQVEALGARLIELFPFLYVREIPSEEYREMNRRVPTGEVHYPVRYDSVEEVEKVVGYRVGRLGKLPDGFVVKWVNASFPHQPLASTVEQAWERPGAVLRLDQTRSGNVTALAEEGTTREMKVHGKPAVLITRTWEGPEGTSMARSLFFSWDGQALSLTISGKNGGRDAFPDEWLIELAESVQ